MHDDYANGPDDNTNVLDGNAKHMSGFLHSGYVSFVFFKFKTFFVSSGRS